MRYSLAIAALFAAVSASAAQQKAVPPATPPVKAQAKTQDTPAQKSAAQPASQKPAAAQPASQKAAAQGKLPTSTVRPGSQLVVVKTDTAGPPPTIMRESFEYSRDGRRDPFNSLLTTNELRPTMSDLRLTGILFDHAGRNSVATLRDITNQNQYRVTTGSTLGRMRVTAIRTMTVVFTIDEFGTTRRDSLTLRDSTKARIK